MAIPAGQSGREFQKFADGDKPVVQTTHGRLQRVTGTTSSVAAGGNLILNVTGFVNFAKISEIHVVGSASTDFDVEIYEKDTFVVANRRYQNIDNNLFMHDSFVKSLDYRDLDSTSELHIKFINTDAVNASTFTYDIRFVSVV